jgi:CheY-like chemotaxis protein
VPAPIGTDCLLRALARSPEIKESLILQAFDGNACADHVLWLNPWFQTLLCHRGSLEVAAPLNLEKSDNPADAVPLALVVEDSEDDFILLQTAFQKAGVRVRIEWARDGFEARTFLEKALASGNLPVGFVLDLRLPRMDGFDVLSYINAELRLNGIPVNVLTTSNNPTDMARAYRLGARDYLVKPGPFESLVQMSQGLEAQWRGSRRPTE